MNPHEATTAVPESSSRVLVIDDEAMIHDDFRKILVGVPDIEIANEAALFGDTQAKAAGPNFEIECATQGAEGLRLLESARREGRPFAVAFVDMRMPPGWDGVETIVRLWAADPHLQVVICTAYSDYSWGETVAKLGAGDNWVILKKPFDNIEALQLAHSLSNKWRIARRDRLRVASLDEAVQRRTAELRRSEQRFLKAFQGNPLPVTLQAVADGRYLDANFAFLQLVGRDLDAIIGRRPDELELWAGADLWADSLRSIETNQPLRGARGTVRTAGSAREVLLSVDRIEIDDTQAVLTSLQDITERLELERQLRQSQKMEAVGQLAAGVAHDFNNVLTVIQSFTGLALEDATLTEEHRQGLKQVELAAQRATRLTRQLLLFSRKQIAQPRRLELAACIDGFREMLRCVLPASVELHLKHEPNLPQVEADEANLGQVLMNLVVNARDALPKGGGQIWIRTSAVTLDEAAGRRTSDSRPGRFVCLAVEDNGTGIDAAIVPRIFEPFFTTKGVGEGTGLGLSMVYGIMRQHGGWVEVDSRKGQGSRFQLFLPALETTAAIPPASRGGTLPGPRGCGERLLLVEDETPVRTATKLIATRAGYAVTEAADGVMALGIAATQAFDVLITDMVMPNGLSGVDLAKRLRQNRPELPVILTTGYSEQLVAEKTCALENTVILLKPYTAEALLSNLRTVLGARGATTGGG